MIVATGDYVNDTLGQVSDLLFFSAIVVYVIAAGLYLVALAATRDVRAGAAELASVGASGGPAAGDRTPGVVGGPVQRRSVSDRFAAMAFPVVLLGMVAQISSIVVRGFATGRAPWGNMYEFISLTCAAAVIAAVVVLRKPSQRPLLGLVLLPMIVLMFIGGRYLYTQAAPVVPALKSYWLAIHVSVISIASGVLVTSGVMSLLYLAKLRWRSDEAAAERDAEAPGIGAAARRILDRVPSAARLDRYAYKTVVVGFPLLSLGIVFGAIWAEAAWGRYWAWDPKETVSFISWVIYAAYLHARATAGWKVGAAWINVAGFASVVFNLFFVNLVVSGLHSYAGVG